MRLPSRLVTALPLSAAVLLGPSGCQMRGHGGEKPIAMNQLTPEARETIERETGGATLKTLTTSQDDSGQVTYEAGFVRGTSQFELEVGADGLVHAVEEKLNPAELPDAVREAVSRELPTAVVSSAERVVKAGVTTYEVDAELRLSKWELVISPDGTIVKKDMTAFDARSKPRK